MLRAPADLAYGAAEEVAGVAGTVDVRTSGHARDEPGGGALRVDKLPAAPAAAAAEGGGW